MRSRVGTGVDPEAPSEYFDILRMVNSHMRRNTERVIEMDFERVMNNLAKEAEKYDTWNYTSLVIIIYGKLQFLMYPLCILAIYFFLFRSGIKYNVLISFFPEVISAHTVNNGLVEMKGICIIKYLLWIAFRRFISSRNCMSENSV